MKRTLTLFLLATALTVSAQSDSWNLQRCLEYAAEHNIDLKRAEQTVALSEVNRQQSYLSFLPSVSANGGYYWNFGLTIDPITNTRQPGSRQTFSSTLQGNWTLINGGRNVFQLQQARLNAAAALYGMEDMRNNVYLNITSAFLQIMVNELLLDVADGQYKTSLNNLERVEVLYQNGALAKGDYLQSVSQVKADESNFVNAEVALTLSKLQLFQILQLKEGFEDFDIESPELEVEAELSIRDYNKPELFEAAVSAQPSVKSAVVNLKSAEVGVNLAKSATLPTINMMAQLNSNYVAGLPYFTEYEKITTYTLLQDPDDPAGLLFIPNEMNVPVASSQTPYTFGNQFADNWNQFFGFGISVPIFSQGQVHAAVQRAKIQQATAALDLEQTKTQVRQTVERAYLDATNSFVTYQSAKASSTSAAEALNYAQVSFDEGVISAFELVSTKNAYLAAKSREIQGMFDYIFKVKVLEFYLFGQMTL